MRVHEPDTLDRAKNIARAEPKEPFGQHFDFRPCSAWAVELERATARVPVHTVPQPSIPSGRPFGIQVLVEVVLPEFQELGFGHLVEPSVHERGQRGMVLASESGWALRERRVAHLLRALLEWRFRVSKDVDWFFPRVGRAH